VDNIYLRKYHKAFTLIELLVVISIIGMLASITVVSVNGAKEKARDLKRTNDTKTISDVIEMYYFDAGHYPPIDYSNVNDDPNDPVCGQSVYPCYKVNWIHNGIDYLDLSTIKSVPIPINATGYNNKPFIYRTGKIGSNQDLSRSCIKIMLEKDMRSTQCFSPVSMFWCERGFCDVDPICAGERICPNTES